MPKEKTTRKAAPKTRGPEKRKKGKHPVSLPFHADRADPNAPKRGLSAYMFFANEQREKVREDNPGITFGQYPSMPHSALTALTPSRPGRQDAR